MVLHVSSCKAVHYFLASSSQLESDVRTIIVNTQTMRHDSFTGLGPCNTLLITGFSSSREQTLMYCCKVDFLYLATHM